MILIKTSVRLSPIQGRGLFCEEAVRRGSLVAIYTHDQTIISEKEYMDRLRARDELVRLTGCRWIDHLCIYSLTGMEDEDYINHSADPNLLYHCGVFFARRDLWPGDELTVDYKYILAEEEPGFVDVATDQYVRGLAGRDAILQSARELLNLLGSDGELVLNTEAAS